MITCLGLPNSVTRSPESEFHEDPQLIHVHRVPSHQCHSGRKRFYSFEEFISRRFLGKALQLLDIHKRQGRNGYCT
ncbi:hypothetical protein AAY473_013320 [Plecturocebus cupreus]